MLHCVTQRFYILSHIWLAFDEEVKIHGIKMHHYRNIHTMFSNISEYPPNIGYNAYNFKYGLINETTNMPLGKYITNN